MIQPPDPSIADSVGNWLAFALAVFFGLWRRRRQNTVFAAEVGDSVHTEVSSIKSSLKTTQDLVAIHTDRIKEANQIAAALGLEMARCREDMSKITDVVQRGEALVEQFNNYLERAKTGTLIEVPIEGSGGATVLRKKE